MKSTTEMAEEARKATYQTAYYDGYRGAAESALWGLIGYVTDEMNIEQVEAFKKKMNLKFDLVLNEKRAAANVEFECCDKEGKTCLPLL